MLSVLFFHFLSAKLWLLVWRKENLRLGTRLNETRIHLCRCSYCFSCRNLVSITLEYSCLGCALLITIFLLFALIAEDNSEQIHLLLLCSLISMKGDTSICLVHFAIFEVLSCMAKIQTCCMLYRQLHRDWLNGCLSCLELLYFCWWLNVTYSICLQLRYRFYDS